MNNRNLSATKTPFPSARLETAVLYSIFLLTGAAVVLPGTLLPLLSHRWRMGDGAAGLFFLCFSVGSSAGAVLARGRLSHVLAAGCALAGLGAFLLSAVHVGAPLLSVVTYGCGLGLSMTSVSLLRSRRRSQARVPELARLNLVWAIGAGAGPAILLRSAARFDTSFVLHTTAVLFGLSAVLVLLTVPNIEQGTDRQSLPAGNWMHSLRAVPLVVLCLIPLATGIEGGINSWLSSYIMRGGYLLNVTISAITAFGAGVIISRIVYARSAAAAFSSRFVVRLHAALILVGIVLLLRSTSPFLSVAAAFLTGLGVGPMYPFLLAILLNHDEAGNVGFLAGGLGASVLPLTIGALSGWTHSLRTGLAVPLAAASLMLVLSARLARPAESAE